MQGRITGGGVVGEQSFSVGAEPEERQPGVFGPEVRGAVRCCLVQWDSAGSEEQLLQPCVCSREAQ